MSENIVKKKIIRQISSEDWGQSARLVEEEGYSIEEFTVLSGKTVQVRSNNSVVYFIIASGTSEFDFINDKKKFFKGDKICLSEFCKEQENNFINIANCGVIPLILIKVSLKA